MRSPNSIAHCITVAAAIFLTSTSLALAGAVINEKGYTQKQWEDCGAKAIREDLEQGVRDGSITSIDEPGGYYGAAGRGQWVVIKDACGGQPTDGKLDDAMKKALHEGCVALRNSVACETAGKDDCILNAFDHLSTVHAIAFDSYADKSRLIHNARAMCAKIYTSHAKERKKARAEAGERKSWRIARLYASSESGVRIVIETDRTRKMKCAVYDSAGEPLAVDTGVITPPIDDLLIIAPARSRSVDNARCWSE